MSDAAMNEPLLDNSSQTGTAVSNQECHDDSSGRAAESHVESVKASDVTASDVTAGQVTASEGSATPGSSAGGVDSTQVSAGTQIGDAIAAQAAPTVEAHHLGHHHGGECCSTPNDSVAQSKCETTQAVVSLTTDGAGAPDQPAADAVAAPDELTLLTALKQVVDPELFVNVVDLGLVYAVHQEDAKVTVDMTLTSPACPAGPQIVQQAKQALEAVPGVKEATIKLVMTPPWSPDRMTDDARDHLGIF